jgi:hypothetical protein
MKRFFVISACVLAGALAGCGSSDSGTSTSTSGSSGSSGGSSGGSTGGGAPTIAITAPADNATVTVGTDASKSVPVTLAVTNFTLMAIGSCANHHDDHCGHVHLLVDGTACNDPNAGGPYNNDATSDSAAVHLAPCPTATGAHTIVAELHHDDHSPVVDSSGATISSTIHVTAQ